MPSEPEGTLGALPFGRGSLGGTGTERQATTARTNPPTEPSLWSQRHHAHFALVCNTPTIRVKKEELGREKEIEQE